MNTATAKTSKRKRLALVAIAALLLLGAGAALWFRAGGRNERQAVTFVARRGPLNITVLEGGSLQSLESQEIKCEVRVGYQGLKILKIVEEGYEVTLDDIRTNKVLVELDSSELQKQIVQQDIQYESSAASLTDAQQNYEIQINQNLSDLEAASQKVRFARMDFDKLLGDKITDLIIDEAGINEELAKESTNSPPALVSSAPMTNAPLAIPGGAPPADGVRLVLPPIQGDVAPPKVNGSQAALPSQVPPPPRGAPGQIAGPGNGTNGSASSPVADAPADAAAPQPTLRVDFSKWAYLDKLGDGESKQKLRKFEDDYQVAVKEQRQAVANLEGTRRLFTNGFVTRIDLERDEIAGDNCRLKVQTAQTAQELYLKYEFVRTAEESLSKLAEAVRAQVRAQKAAVSKIAQAEARLKSAQGQFNIQSRQRKELYEQLAKCTITPKRPGLVVYGGGRDDGFYYGGEERIREGATVRERQAIVTIPDLTHMSVRVKIHESYIKKIKKGQKARITVDAYADKILAGEVTQVGVLPDSQNRWMNPDMKVYLTTITIEGTQDWLKPGMSAKVEIFIDQLPDVLYVPVQAVAADNKQQICYLAGLGKLEKRIVEVGQFNDEFIEIKSGLKAGDRVLLRGREGGGKSEEKSDAESPDKNKSAPAKPASTPIPSGPANTAAASPKTKA